MAISKAQESNSTLRNRLMKSIVLAIRELFKKSEFDDDSLDLISFIIVALNQINDTIEQSAVAWEKRNYWIKADKFRLDWAWVTQYAKSLDKLLMENDWDHLGENLVNISQKLNNITVSSNHRLGTPWKGAYKIDSK